SPIFAPRHEGGAMDYRSVGDYVARSGAALAKGPVALVFIEDLIEIASTLRHHQRAGFRQVLALAPSGTPKPDDAPEDVVWITHDTHADNAVPAAINALVAAAPETTWFYYCFNAEYLFFPFCETRSVREMIAFHAEERRDAMLTYVVDLYAADLDRWPGAVDLDSAMLDRAGYYALARHDRQGQVMDRQLHFFGG